MTLLNHSKFLRTSALFSLLTLVTLTQTACQNETQAPPPAPILKVKTLSIDSASQSYTWSLQGTLQAKAQMPLALRVGGLVNEVPIDLGARVREGQTILKLDAADFELAHKSAQAQMAATQADIRQAQSDLKRIKALQARQLATEQTQQQLENKLSALQAQQSANQQQLQQAQNQLTYTKLLAPESGVISAQYVQAHEYVNAGQPIVHLVVDGQREVVVAVPESQVERLPQQAQVLIRQNTYSATLRTVSPQAEQASRTWLAYYALPNQSELDRWPLGQSAQVVFENPVEGVKVPLSALYEEADYASVWLFESGKAKRLAAEVVRINEQFAWVKAEFPPQAKIIALGVHKLSEGMPLEESAQ